ncbi:hypothetical protein ES703_18794 [subsurface metagenome]
MNDEQPVAVCVVKTKSRLIAGAASILLAVGAAVAVTYTLDWLRRSQAVSASGGDITSQTEINLLASSCQ